MLTPVTAAPSPDLRRFTSRGGKLIQFAGWNDSVVPPDGSIDYYLRADAVGEAAEHADQEIDKHIEKLTPQMVAAHGQCVRRAGTAVPPAVHAAGHRPLRRQHRPELGRRRHARAAEAYRDADHHVVSAVIKWVEQGVAPEKIIATQFDAAGNVVALAPGVRVPGGAVYNGSGDINVAANFSCETPSCRIARHRQRPPDIATAAQRDLELPNR